MIEVRILGLDPEDLTDREKEYLAMHLHRYVQDDFDLHPDSVDVEGYGDD